MKVTTQHVPDDCDYLTNGKVYEAGKFKNHKYLYSIRCDNHHFSIILVGAKHFGCDHLNGKSWEVIKDKE